MSRTRTQLPNGRRRALALALTIETLAMHFFCCCSVFGFIFIRRYKNIRAVAICHRHGMAECLEALTNQCAMWTPPPVSKQCILCTPFSDWCDWCLHVVIRWANAAINHFLSLHIKLHCSREFTNYHESLSFTIIPNCSFRSITAAWICQQIGVHTVFFALHNIFTCSPRGRKRAWANIIHFIANTNHK